MTAVRKIRTEEEFVVNTVARTPALKLVVVNHEPPAEAEARVTVGGTLKNLALFIAAPFIGLAYIVALPFVGLAVLAVLAGRIAATKFAAIKTAGYVAKHVGLAVAAPVVGLAYVVFFPVIGLGALVWMAGKAAARN